MGAIIGLLEKDINSNELVAKKMQQVLSYRGNTNGNIRTFSLPVGRGNNLQKFCTLVFDYCSENEDIVITFNGEIYNIDELQTELSKNGCHLKHNSTEEILIDLYKIYGLEGMLSKLDGAFAICIADMQNNKLYLCRDRIGEKPLYIYQGEDCVMFASEYKAFYAHPKFKPELEETVVDEYFLFRYVAGERTFLKGVQNLTPGSYLEINGDNITKRTYWRLPDKISNKKSFDENKETVKRLIDKSVSRRIRSNTTIGLQLSGGVDSSYLCHVITNNFHTEYKTYSITFDNTQFSEEPYIDLVSDRLDLSTRKFLFNSGDFITYWKKATYYFEAPMNHEGTLGLYQLDEQASHELDVMLNGDGPDECMGGYTRLYTMDRILRMKAKPIIMPILKLLAKRKGAAVCNNIEDFAISRSQYIKHSIYKNLVLDSNKKNANKVYKNRRKIFSSVPGKGIRKFMNYEMYTYMQDLAMRTDKISMASSIKARAPYLMPELVEYICEIPCDQLVDSRQTHMYGTKKVLKSLCADAFGDKFTYRSKVGLSFPFIDFFSNPLMREYVENNLLPSIKQRGILNYDYLMTIWNSIPQWKKTNCYDTSILNATWCALSFELWAQMYLDKNPLEEVNI